MGELEQDARLPGSAQLACEPRGEDQRRGPFPLTEPAQRRALPERAEKEPLVVEGLELGEAIGGSKQETGRSACTEALEKLVGTGAVGDEGTMVDELEVQRLVVGRGGMGRSASPATGS